MTLRQMSLSAGILILILVVFRAVALDKLPKRMFLILWAVAVLRLLAPFAIPLPFSLNTLANEVFEQLAPAPVMAVPDAGWRAGVFLPDAVPDPRPVTPEPGAATPPVPAPADGGPPLGALVWTAGMLVVFLCFTVSHIKTRRALRYAVKIQLDGYELPRRVTVWRSDRITTPFAVGLFKPRVYLPQSINTGDAPLMRYVLAHETYHIRRLDALWKLVTAAAVCVHWFNPLVWVMFVLVSRDLEITCDESVIRRFGADSRAAYAYAIIGMVERRGRLSPLRSGFGGNAAEERIRAIMKYGKSSGFAVLLAVTLILPFVFLTACDESRYEPGFTPPPAAMPSGDGDGALPLSAAGERTPAPTPVPEPDIKLPDEWPTAYLPENFPVMRHDAIQDVRRENGDIKMTVTVNSVPTSERGVRSSFSEFTVALMDAGYVTPFDRKIGIGHCKFNQEGTVCDIVEAGRGPDRTVGSEIYPEYVKWKITVKFHQIFTFDTSRCFMDWPALDADLGLEEIVFDEWPTEYLPKLFPAPVGMKPVSMVQRKNGVFITFVGSTGDYDSQIEKAGFKKYRNEGVGHPDYYKNPYVNGHNDRYYYIWDQADLDAITAVLKSEIDDEDVVAAIENINQGRKMVMQVIKGEDTERYWQSLKEQ